MRRFNKSDLEALVECPNQGVLEWLAGAEDSVSYLKVNAENDELVIYASAKSVLIHGVLASTSKVTPPDGHNLLHGSIPMADDCWVIQRSWGGGHGHRMYLEPPLSGSKSFEGGEKLIFRRSFDGVQKGPTPIELSQKLVHSLDLYFVPERNAYCRLDRRGDIEDVIRVIQRKSVDVWEGLDVVTILRKDLDKYMALSDTTLVLKFDFTRVRWGSFSGWGEVEQYEREEPDLFYHGGKNGNGLGSYAHGAIIVRTKVTVDELVQEWKDEEDPKKRQYAKFKIYDRKNKTNVETYCAPGFLSNYFQKSDLPWEVSPAFFRPEILLRFKADPERFTLKDRSITCRNAWHLKTYDINESGQVHTYIGYLADLPYEEQLYWQSFNEWPQGSISERAHQTDILGEWSTVYDPLNALKHTIRELDKSPPEWWIPRGETLSDATRYPATDSPKEWADEILALDQLLVEGFLVKPLQILAEASGRKLDPKWASLKVIQELLVAKERSEAEAKAVVAPMQRVHGLRTVLKGHATTDKRRKAEIEARTEYGSFRSHFNQLATECDKALNEVLSVLGIVLEP